MLNVYEKHPKKIKLLTENIVFFVSSFIFFIL